jgi:hypothetical protein
LPLHVCNCVKLQAMAILGTLLYNKSAKLQKIPAFPFVFVFVFDVNNNDVYVCNWNGNKRQQHYKIKQNKHML